MGELQGLADAHKCSFGQRTARGVLQYMQRTASRAASFHLCSSLLQHSSDCVALRLQPSTFADVFWNSFRPCYHLVQARRQYLYGKRGCAPAAWCPHCAKLITAPACYAIPSNSNKHTLRDRLHLCMTLAPLGCSDAYCTGKPPSSINSHGALHTWRL
jgi:hypothetical protein